MDRTRNSRCKHKKCVNPEFGLLLTALMEAGGMSAYQLSQRTAVANETISRLKNGTRGPTETQVWRLAAGLGLGQGDTNQLLAAADFFVLTEPIQPHRLGGNGTAPHRLPSD